MLKLPKLQSSDTWAPLKMRRAGPGVLHGSACTWTKVSSSNKIQRHYKALKIIACMCSWGKLWKTRYKKTKNPTATSEVLWAKARSCHDLCTQHHPEGGQTTQATLPARPLALPLPSPHLMDQLALPRGTSADTCYLFSVPKAVAWVPVKPSLDFSSGFLSISMD